MQRNPRAEARKWIARTIATRTRQSANSPAVSALAAAIEAAANETGVNIETAVDWCAQLTKEALHSEVKHLAKQFIQEQEA